MIITAINRFVIIIITNNHFDNALMKIFQFRRALPWNMRGDSFKEFANNFWQKCKHWKCKIPSDGHMPNNVAFFFCFSNEALK